MPKNDNGILKAYAKEKELERDFHIARKLAAAAVDFKKLAETLAKVEVEGNRIISNLKEVFDAGKQDDDLAVEVYEVLFNMECINELGYVGNLLKLSKKFEERTGKDLTKAKSMYEKTNPKPVKQMRRGVSA